MESKTVDARGLRFAFLEEGAGPLVLLVHGFPDTAHTWEQVMPAVAAVGFRVVAPFTRGYFPTAVPDDGAYDTDSLAQDIVALVDALGAGDAGAVVVGHDWGAIAAYRAATLAPARLRQLITLAIPHPASVTPTPKVAWSLRHFLALRGKGGPARARRDDFAYVDALVRRWSPAWNVPKGETARVKAAFREPGCLEAACAYYDHLPGADPTPIPVPTVAFAGLHDVVVPAAYQRARRCFSGSYDVVTVPGGHFMHREHPAPFIAELLRVLRR